MMSSSSPLLRCSQVACQRKKGWLEADNDLHPMLPPPPASPVDRLSSIRFRFFALRLARSGLYSPNLRWIDSRTQHMVDDHIRAKKDSKRMKYAKVEDWDSGISDCWPIKKALYGNHLTATTTQSRDHVFILTVTNVSINERSKPFKPLLKGHTFHQFKHTSAYKTWWFLFSHSYIIIHII